MRSLEARGLDVMRITISGPDEKRWPVNPGTANQLRWCWIPFALCPNTHNFTRPQPPIGPLRLWSWALVGWPRDWHGWPDQEVPRCLAVIGLEDAGSDCDWCAVSPVWALSVLASSVLTEHQYFIKTPGQPGLPTPNTLRILLYELGFSLLHNALSCQNNLFPKTPNKIIFKISIWWRIRKKRTAWNVIFNCKEGFI